MQQAERILIAAILIAALLHDPASAKTRLGDRLINEARQLELKDTTADVEAALKLAEQALETDRSDIAYQLDVARLRAFAAQYHVYEGQVLRDKGKIKEAILEFERAKALDPSSVIAPQELERTKDLLNEIRRNPNTNIEDLLARPLGRKAKRDEARFSNTAPVPALNVELEKPLPLIKVNNQAASEVFLAIGREAGIRVLFDPDYQNRPLGLNQQLDLRGLALDQALDYIALITKSFWKPLAGDTVFVSNDDPARRSSYEEQITKALFLTNAPAAQDVVEIANTVQKVTDIKKVQVHPSQNVIVARADPDRLALAEKVVADLDKPKAEIIVDVIILSVSKNWSRELGVQFLGLSKGTTNVLFNPGPALNPATIGGRIGVPLDSLQRIEQGDFNVTLPGAALNLLLETRGTKVLDKAQLRTIEGQKSVLRIGQRIPYATGSFIPGSSGFGSALVNTQFQYFDVGLNIDVLAKVHEPDEVSLHVESDTSAVIDRVDLGGVLQPVISQRKRVADVRVKEGEINFWDIVTQRQDVRNTSGLPFLSQIPLLGRAFSNENLQKSESQVLTLLVPHVIRAPDIREVNLMGLPSGSEQVVRVRYQTPQGRTVASKTTDRVLELEPGNAAAAMPQAGPPQGMQQPGAAPQPAPPQPQQAAMAQPGGASQSGPVKIYIRPPAAQPAVNSTVSAELMIEGAENVASGIVALQFDPGILQVEEFTPGTGISETTGSAPRSGIVVLAIGPGPAGRTLATMRFRVLRASTVRVQIVAARLLDAQNLEIRGQSQDMTIEVGGR